MKRLFAIMLCVGALAAFAHGQTDKQTQPGAQAKSAQDKTAQEKPAPPSYDVYVGRYEVAKDIILNITNEQGKLMGQPTGDAKIEFKPEAAADQFFSSQENVHLKFVRDEKGEVTSVVVKLDGKDYPAKKLIK